jgi:hypothetical protein
MNDTTANQQDRAQPKSQYDLLLVATSEFLLAELLPLQTSPEAPGRQASAKVTQ